jgi:hypothetical protein
MDVDKLIKKLQGLPKGSSIQLACDEEWNVLFNKIELEQDDETKDYVIFGLSGSETNI